MPSKRKKNGKIIGWRAQVRRKGTHRSQDCSTKDEAKELEAQWIQEIDRQMTTLTVLEWATDYLDYSQKRFTDKTYQEKREAMDLIVRIVGAKAPVESIEVAHALRGLDAVAEHRSGHAANKVRKNLVAAWNWGRKHMDKWQAVLNPFAQVEPYSYQRQERYVPPMDDVQAVLDIMPEDDRAMLLTYLHTGARRDEVFRLRWQDVDFAGVKITLWTRKRKGGSWESDTIPMTGILKDALLRQRAKSDGRGHVFTWQGKQFKFRRHWLEYWCGVAGVPKFSFHCIRHLTASWLDAHGVPLRKIQAILRHKSTTTTDRYLHELKGVDCDLDSVFGDGKSKVLDMKEASGESSTEGL